MCIYIYIYIHTHTHTHAHAHIYKVLQEDKQLFVTPFGKDFNSVYEKPRIKEGMSGSFFYKVAETSIMDSHNLFDIGVTVHHIYK